MHNKPTTTNRFQGVVVADKSRTISDSWINFIVSDTNGCHFGDRSRTSAVFPGILLNATSHSEAARFGGGSGPSPESSFLGVWTLHRETNIVRSCPLPATVAKSTKLVRRPSCLLLCHSSGLLLYHSQRVGSNKQVRIQKVGVTLRGRMVKWVHDPG